MIILQIPNECHRKLKNQIQSNAEITTRFKVTISIAETKATTATLKAFFCFAQCSKRNSSTESTHCQNKLDKPMKKFPMSIQANFLDLNLQLLAGIYERHLPTHIWPAAWNMNDS
ncbi:Pre-mRNA-splicing factor [Trichinella spiralis]|uniref:Pre-mRNA-splicing factor n=1 Tax=Trichinella spiralis TaxID=6334 RepID=A0ABR3KJ38_TRISP